MTFLDRAIVKAYRRQAETAGHRTSSHASGALRGPIGAPPRPVSDPIEPDSVEPPQPTTWNWPELCAQLLDQTPEGFDRLADYLTEAADKQHMGAIALTSLERGEGTTSVLLTLARVFSERATHKILLVEADFERPSLRKLLDPPPILGLWEVVEGRASLWQVLQGMTTGVLSVLPLTGPVSQSQLNAGQVRLKSLLAELRSQFDLMLLDAGPISATEAVENSWLSGTVDGVVTVSSSRKRTRQFGMEATVTSWEQAGVESLGVIETFA